MNAKRKGAIAAIEHALTLARKRGAAATIRDLEDARDAFAELAEAGREMHDALHEQWTDDESRARVKRRNVAAIERHAAALAKLDAR